MPISVVPFLINNIEPTETTGRQRGTQRRSRINTSLPTSDGDTGVGDTRPPRQRRLSTAAVEHNRNEDNTTCRRQGRGPSTGAVEPTTNPRNTRQRRQRTPATADGEPGTDEDPSKPRKTRVFAKDLTPAERDIPGTSLLHDLGNHLSAYARAGRVRHIAICYCSSCPSLFLFKVET